MSDAVAISDLLIDQSQSTIDQKWQAPEDAFRSADGGALHKSKELDMIIGSVKTQLYPQQINGGGPSWVAASTRL